MGSMKVVQFPSKVPVHRAHQLFCFGGMPMKAIVDLKTVGSEAYIQFLHRMQYMRYVFVYGKVSWKV